MFKLLRQKAKIFYWVIAATFILFLFLGGMTNRGCQAPGSKSLEIGVIGTVNGSKITSQQYQEMYQGVINQMRQQSPSNVGLNANQHASAREQAWNYLVAGAIQEQAVEEYDIKVTDAEILDVFQNNPPQALLQSFRREDGTVDMNAYYAELRNPDNDFSAAEDFVRNTLTSQKLSEAITAGVAVSDEDVREEYTRQTGKAVAEYMGLLYANLADDYEPTEAEIQSYYDSHGDEYERQAQAVCKVVTYTKQPSAEDIAEVETIISEIREEILAGQRTFENAARDFGEDNTSSKGGELGFFDRNRFDDEFNEVAFNLPVGEISQPVKTKFGFHLIEVLEQEIEEETGDTFRIKARHILLKIATGQDTLEQLSLSASEFSDRVDASSFVSTAEAEDITVLSPEPFIEGRDIPGIPLSLRGSLWVFNAEIGAVSRVFENRDVLYVILAEEILPAGPAPLDKVQSQVVMALKNEHKKEIAKSRLAPAVGEVQMGRTMAEAAETANLIHATSDTFTINSNITDVGYGTEFNKMAIEGQVDTMIPEVETLRGLYALKPLWIKDFDQADFNKRQVGIREALISRTQNEAYGEWYTERLESAEIIDQRDVERNN